MANVTQDVAGFMITLATVLLLLAFRLAITVGYEILRPPGVRLLLLLVVSGLPLRRLSAPHMVALLTSADLLLRIALLMVSACMSVTTGTAATVPTTMKSTTITIQTPSAGHGTGGATEAPESAAGSAHDRGSAPAEFGKPDTQGPRLHTRIQTWRRLSHWGELERCGHSRRAHDSTWRQWASPGRWPGHPTAAATATVDTVG